MTTMRTPLRRLLPIIFVAAAVALGSPAIASAEWDIEKYDECMKEPHLDHSYHHENCCIESGGEFIDWVCVAPAAEAQGEGTPTPKPPKAGIPTALVQPPDVGTSPAPKLGVPIVPVLPTMVG